MVLWCGLITVEWGRVKLTQTKCYCCCDVCVWSCSFFDDHDMMMMMELEGKLLEDEDEGEIIQFIHLLDYTFIIL